MNTHTAAPVRQSRPTILVATRWLAGLHAFGAFALLGLAIYLFASFAMASDEENLAGVAVIFGAGYVVIGAVLMVLALGALLVKSPGVVYGCGLAAGLFGFVVAGPATFLFMSSPLLGPAVAVPSLALIICSVVGLVRRARGGEAPRTTVTSGDSNPL